MKATVGEGFYSAVYAAVRGIPRGCVATYGQVARLVGQPRAARAVGWALRALDARTAHSVPWHRVVGQGGRISLRAGLGPLEQRRRLRAEGLRFVRGCVDMARHGLVDESQRAAGLTRARRRRTAPDAGAGRRAPAGRVRRGRAVL